MRALALATLAPVWGLPGSALRRAHMPHSAQEHAAAGAAAAAAATASPAPHALAGSYKKRVALPRARCRDRRNRKVHPVTPDIYQARPRGLDWGYQPRCC